MTGYIHPSEMTDEQRRANTAAILERFARAHDLACEQGLDGRPGGEQIQRDAAASARRVARRLSGEKAA